MKRSPDAAHRAVRAKARWVLGGHRSKQGYHWLESACNGCLPSTLRLLCFTSVYKQRLLMSTDIKQAFTSAPLEAGVPNNVYVRLPTAIKSFDSRGVEVVQLMLKSCYWLPNAGYSFDLTLNAHLTKMGYERSCGDIHLHRKTNGKGELTLLGQYIDDGSGIFPSQEDYQQYLNQDMQLNHWMMFS